ncbi:MAG: 16S rRNA (guanine(527)-N(7))-methyltransferase RsmG [Clostridia bacterium]|nr:16S rRNA (guanine(527)-N(7))-methyltransferase RsmG [Clostridia bacterium]
MNKQIESYFTKENIKISKIQLKLLSRYKELLLDWNNKINLTAIVEEKEFYYKHFIDSLLLLKIKELELSGKSIIDVGTGAGFPGLPLAIMQEGLFVTLSDSLNKRIEFLKEATKELELPNIYLLEGRAEDLGKNELYRENFDYSVARAVSKMSVLLEYTLPFVKVDGYFIAYKGPEYEEELKESKKALEILGGEIEKVYNFKIDEFEMERNIIFIKKTKSTPEKYPRRAGVPAKKPL